MSCMPSKAFSATRKTRGFTLVELVVVILIIGILSFAIGPRFFSVNSYQDRRAIDELLTTLRYSQQLAMSRGGNIQISINATQYQVQRTVAPVTLRSPDGVTPYIKSLPDNITLTPANVTIVYDSMGRPVPNVATTFSVGSQNIRIEQETGYAHRL